MHEFAVSVAAVSQPAAFFRSRCWPCVGPSCGGAFAHGKRQEEMREGGAPKNKQGRVWEGKYAPRPAPARRVVFDVLEPSIPGTYPTSYTFLRTCLGSLCLPCTSFPKKQAGSDAAEGEGGAGAGAGAATAAAATTASEVCKSTKSFRGTILRELYMKQKLPRYIYIRKFK